MSYFNGTCQIMSILFLKLLLYFIGLALFYKVYRLNKNYLNKKRNAYFELTQYLGKRILSVSSFQLPTPSGNYYFFSSIISEIEKYGRYFGRDTSTELVEIRTSMEGFHFLQKEKKRIRDEALIQMLLTSAMVWGFIYFFKAIVEIETRGSVKVGIFIWQLSGILLFVFVIEALYKFLFKSYDFFYCELVKLQSYHHMGMSLGEISKKVNIETLLQGSLDLKNLSTQLKNALRCHREEGSPMDDELRQLFRELTKSRKLVEARYEAYLKGLKLAFLVFFQVLCYFFYLYIICTKYLIHF